MCYRRMIKKKINEKNIFFFFIILVILVLGITLILTFINHNSIIIGEQPYYHLRIAKEISEKKNIQYDTLSYGGREYIFDPYDYFLAFLYKSFGMNVFMVLQFILGIISLIIFYFIIKKIRLNLLSRALIMLTLILSPIFVYTFTVLNKHSLVIFLTLFGFLLFLQKKKIFNIISIIIFSIIPLLNTLASLITILLVLCYALYNKRKIKQFYLILIFVFLINILYNLILYLKYGFPEKITFISINYLQTLISDLGGFAGLSFFNIILMLIGITVTWKLKKKIWLVYITIIILLVNLSYFSYSTIYLKFVITIFAGIGFYKLASMKWKLKFIRNLTVFILILGLIFSTTSYISRIINSLPDKNIKESLEFLDIYSDPEEIVLSHYSRGFWINYFSKRAVVMDSLFTYAPKPNERYRDINAIFYGVNLKDTKELLDKYKINYIYIDNEMKQGLVWKKKKQGLLFLFRNKETFRKIYEKDGIEIWQYKQD